jgi:hypothetical protein
MMQPTNTNAAKLNTTKIQIASVSQLKPSPVLQLYSLAIAARRFRFFGLACKSGSASLACPAPPVAIAALNDRRTLPEAQVRAIDQAMKRLSSLVMPLLPAEGKHGTRGHLRFRILFFI